MTITAYRLAQPAQHMRIPEPPSTAHSQVHHQDIRPNITAPSPGTAAILVEHPSPRGTANNLLVTVSGKPYKIHMLDFHNQTQNITITHATESRSPKTLPSS